MTPAMSLSLSHLETWATTLSCGPGLPSPVTIAGRLTSARVPSSRVKRPGSPAPVGSATPMAPRIAATAPSSRWTFFGENGSIEGGMVHILRWGTHSGANWRLVKT